jgi:hypothetical protein
MQDILLQKLLNWTPEAADTFYQGLERYTYAGDQIWEIAPTGFYLTGSGMSAYYDYNGKSYILQYQTSTADSFYQSKKEFSDQADATTGILIEKPVSIETCDILNMPALYIEQQRPYNTYGIPMINAVTVSADQKVAVCQSAFTAFISAVDNLIGLIDAKMGDTTSPVYPSMLMSSFYYDPTTTNWFWADPIQFNLERDVSISDIGRFVNSIEYIMPGLSNSGLTAILKDYIKTKCTTLQSL